MNDDQLEEMYRLTRENNHMLHAMRRGAFLSGLLKLVIYAAILIVPIWFYMTYLNGSVQQLLQEVNRVETTAQQAQSQFNSLQANWQQFSQKFGATSSSTSAK